MSSAKWQLAHLLFHQYVCECVYVCVRVSGGGLFHDLKCFFTHFACETHLATSI